MPVVPAPGFASFRRTFGAVTGFDAHGPFSPGCIIDRLEWRIFGDRPAGAWLVSVGAVIGPSAVAAQEGVEAGRSLLASTQITNNIPTLDFAATGELGFVWSIPIGIEVRSGPLYVLTMVRNSTTDVTSWVQTSVFVKTVVAIGDAPAVGPVGRVVGERR